MSTAGDDEPENRVDASSASEHRPISGRQNLREDSLRNALGNLSYRERRVIELRYGLAGGHPRTHDEVGRTFNVTRERIRQIEIQSLKKLQRLPEAQALRDDGRTASDYASDTLRHRI
jgi:RNA polymerase sigma factor (sigma-70 family)